MKTLTLLRHAKSSWKDRDLPDHARPLSRRGERDAPAMATRISEAGIRPSLILSSPAVRAWNTARIVAKEINYPLEFLQREEQLYMAGTEDFLALLGQLDRKFNSVMLVGHNPGLTDFANYLMPNVTRSIPTSGVISMTVDTKDWNLAEGSGVELLVFDYPKKDRS